MTAQPPDRDLDPPEEKAVAEKRDAAPTEQVTDAQTEAPHEAELFPPGVEPQYFGTGSYISGGSNAEGNYGLGDTNPRGGYGTFQVAGGYGAAQLYGEEVPPAEARVTPEPAKADAPPATTGKVSTGKSSP